MGRSFCCAIVFLALQFSYLTNGQAEGSHWQEAWERSGLASFCNYDGQTLSCDPPTVDWRTEDRLKVLQDFGRLQASVRILSLSADQNRHFLENLSAIELSYESWLHHSASRRQMQEVLVQRYNRRFNCAIVQPSPGEQVTFGRELWLSSCRSFDSSQAAQRSEILRELAETTAPEEAQLLRQSADREDLLGSPMEDLRRQKERLQRLGLLVIQEGHWQVRHVGHPFESAKDGSAEFSAYVAKTKFLEERLAQAGETDKSLCAAEICDTELYELSEAVATPFSIHPGASSIETFQRTSAQELNSFGEKYVSKERLLNGLGLRWPISWTWRPETFTVQWNVAESAIEFPDVFRKENILFSVGVDPALRWPEHILPMLLAVQEIRALLERSASGPVRLVEMPPRWREIRLLPYGEPRIRRVDRLYGARLELHVLRPPEALNFSVGDMRREIQNQMMDVLSQAETGR